MAEGMATEEILSDYPDVETPARRVRSAVTKHFVVVDKMLSYSNPPGLRRRLRGLDV